MTVRTRLMVFGAILPALTLVIAALAGGWLFRGQQLDELDRRLLAQAAVESVGLFDAPGGAPHVHVDASPIAAEVKAFAPEATIYDARGARVVEVADPALVPARVPLVGPLDEVRLETRVIGGIERRVLELPVRAPTGDVYTLWLGASLAPLEATMSRFYRATLGTTALLALALLVLQLVIARGLARRVDTMIAFLPRLRDGDTALEPDPSRDELGQLRHALRDVAVRLAEARAEQDRLLAGAAHELRTPLTVLRTEIDLALRKDRSADELRAALREVRDDVARLGGLAAELLDLQAVRHLGFDRRAGDLAALVREACAGLATLADARRLELRVDGRDPAPAHFDERALRQAVDNLLGNALKYGQPGTAIDVHIDRIDDRWRIAVTNAGPPIPASEADRIFEPFHRRGPGPGAGLGLAIVRDVALRHGGRVWLDATHAGGARFVLELGDAPPTREHTPAAPATDARPHAT